jgi:hypothetical protein
MLRKAMKSAAGVSTYSQWTRPVEIKSTVPISKNDWINELSYAPMPRVAWDACFKQALFTDCIPRRKGQAVYGVKIGNKVEAGMPILVEPRALPLVTFIQQLLEIIGGYGLAIGSDSKTPLPYVIHIFCKVDWLLFTSQEIHSKLRTCNNRKKHSHIAGRDLLRRLGLSVFTRIADRIKAAVLAPPGHYSTAACFVPSSQHHVSVNPSPARARSARDARSSGALLCTSASKATAVEQLLFLLRLGAHRALLGGRAGRQATFHYCVVCIIDDAAPL